MRGTERVPQEFPLRYEMLLIVTRMGRDYRPGLRQRIEQVARQGSSPYAAFAFEASHPAGQSVLGITGPSHGFPSWRAFTYRWREAWLIRGCPASTKRSAAIMSPAKKETNAIVGVVPSCSSSRGCRQAAHAPC